ncbi:ABC transporter substrate-binding protein [soil metagenome]
MISNERRRLLEISAKALALAPLVPLLATSLSSSANATERPLRIMIPALPYFELVQKYLQQFSIGTGIPIQVDVLPYLDMRDIQLKELQQKQGKYDLIIMLAAWKTEYVEMNLLSNLDAEQKAGRFKIDDTKDFVPSYLTVAGKVGGENGYLDGPQAHLYALPLGAETSILAYRSDIFQKYHWTPPTNYDELMALLPLIQKNEPALIPLCSRGARGHQITHAWLLHFNAYGGEIFDKNWQPKVNSTAGITAIKVLKAIHSTTRGGILNNNFADMGHAFITGKAAMYLDSTTVFSLINDPIKSLVQDKVAYGLHPKGSIYSSETGGFAIAMPKNAPAPRQALQLLAAITSKTQDKAMARKGGVPVRNSTLHDPELQNIFPEYAVLAKQLTYANTNWRPIIREWATINEHILGTLLHDAVAGTIAPAAALEQAHDKIKTLMRNSGRYKS